MGENVGYTGGEGYLAVPEAGTGPGPAVIVIREQWSLPHIKTLADRFAEAGFVALAVDLRTPAGGEWPRSAEESAQRIDAAVADIAAASAFLAGRSGEGPGVDRVAVVGSGSGGSLALWAAGRRPEVAAAVAFYPRLATSPPSVDWSGFENKRVLIHYSASTPSGVTGAPAFTVDQVQASVDAAGGKCIRYDYPGAEHAFFNDDRPEVYDVDAAARAWARTLDFLRAQSA